MNLCSKNLIPRYLIFLGSLFHFANSSSQSKASRSFRSTQSAATPWRQGVKITLGRKSHTSRAPFLSPKLLHTYVYTGINTHACKHTHTYVAVQQAKMRAGGKRPRQERRKCPLYICRLPPAKAFLNTIG